MTEIEKIKAARKNEIELSNQIENEKRTAAIREAMGEASTEVSVEYYECRDVEIRVPNHKTIEANLLTCVGGKLRLANYKVMGMFYSCFADALIGAE